MPIPKDPEKAKLWRERQRASHLENPKTAARIILSMVKNTP